MKKVLLLFIIFGVLFTAVPVRADGPEEIKANGGCSSALLGSTQPVKTKSKYYAPAYYLQLLLNIMKYAGIIACIALSTVDFFKVLLADDKDGYKKVISKTIKRMGYAVAIFFLPIIVMKVLELAGIVTNATCGIQ